MATLLETVYLESAPNVDSDKGEIRGVKLLGMESRNKRRYEAAAMKEAVGLYNGRKVYIDHPSRESAGGERSIKDWAGTIRNARFESDGIYGDVKLRKASPYFAGIIEAACEFPKDIGFSHVADGDSRYDGDTEIVESIKSVFSVDLVTDPAATGGFFESQRPRKKTVRAAIESLPESVHRTRLIEMIGATYDTIGLGEEEKPADPLSQAYALVQALIGQLGKALETLASKEASPAPAPMPSAPPAPEDDMNDEDKKKADETAKAFESLQKTHAEATRKLAEAEAKSQLLESGREATEARVKALANAAEADRPALLESWPASEQQAAPERPSWSPPAYLESETGELEEINDPKRYAASLR